MNLLLDALLNPEQQAEEPSVGTDVVVVETKVAAEMLENVAGKQSHEVDAKLDHHLAAEMGTPRDLEEK